MFCRRVFGAAVTMAAVAAAISEGATGGRIGTGMFLVASSKSRDPDLSKTVILLIHYDAQGAIGLILNRRTDVPISRVFPSIQHGNAGTDRAYLGGPVALGARALVRARNKPPDAEAIFADVYIISSAAAIQRMIEAGPRSGTWRVYAGYTGWSERQLLNEVQGGLWHVLHADAATVFDAHPESVWQRLTQRVGEARPGSGL